MVCSTLVRNSLAVTLRMPLASIWNCTCTRGMPAGIGGMPPSRNLASERLSPPRSPAPVTTFEFLPQPPFCEL